MAEEFSISFIGFHPYVDPYERKTDEEIQQEIDEMKKKILKLEKILKKRHVVTLDAPYIEVKDEENLLPEHQES